MSFALIFLSQIKRYSTLGGSLKFCQGIVSGCFCMRFHFFIKASFIIDTKGWYCVTKGNISFSSLLFCFKRAAFVSVSFTSNGHFSLKILCVACVHQALLKSEIFSPQRSLFVGFSRLLVCQIHFNNWWVIRGENLYTGRFSFKMRHCVNGTFFSFFVECCALVCNRV